MRLMHWSWQDYLSTPVSIIDGIVKQVTAEQKTHGR